MGELYMKFYSRIKEFQYMSKKMVASVIFFSLGSLASSASADELTRKLHPIQYQASIGGGYNFTQKEPLAALEASLTHIPLVTEYHPVLGSPSIDMKIRSSVFLNEPESDAISMLISSRLNVFSSYLFEEGMYLETGAAARFFGHHNSKFAQYGGSYVQVGQYRGIMTLSAYMEILANDLNVVSVLGMDSNFKVHEDLSIGISASEYTTAAIEKDLYFPGYFQLGPKFTLFQHFLLQPNLTLNGLSAQQDGDFTPRQDVSFIFLMGYTGEKDIDPKTVFRF